MWPTHVEEAEGLMLYYRRNGEGYEELPFMMITYFADWDGMNPKVFIGFEEIRQDYNYYGSDEEMKFSNQPSEDVTKYRHIATSFGQA